MVDVIVRSVYSTELSDILINFLHLSEKVVRTQYTIGDTYGMRIDIDDKVINYKTFGHHFY